MLGTNFLKQLNFNTSEKGLQIKEKRIMKEVKVSYVTISSQVITDKKITHVSYIAPRDTRHTTGKFASQADSVRKEQLSLNTPNTDKVNIPLNIQDDGSGENKAIITNPVETTEVYLAETANSINIQEIDVSYIINNDIKTELIKLINNYKLNKIKETI